MTFVVVVVVIVWRVVVVSQGSLSAHVFAAHVRTAMGGFRALLEGPCDVECSLVDGELEMRKGTEEKHNGWRGSVCGVTRSEE